MYRAFTNVPLVATLLLAQLASAQDAHEIAIDRRSPGAAIGLSILIPGADQIYAGRPVLGTALLGTFVAGYAMAARGSQKSTAANGNSRTGVSTLGGIGILASLAASTYGIVTAANDVDRYNERLVQGALRVQIQPLPPEAGRGQPLTLGVARDDRIRVDGRLLLVVDGNATVGVRRLEGWYDSLTVSAVHMRLDSVAAAAREVPFSQIATIDVERRGASGWRKFGFSAVGYLLGSIPGAAIDCSGKSSDCMSLIGLLGGIAGGVVGWRYADDDATHWERILVMPAAAPE